MVKAGSSFDLVIDTVPVKHDLNPYLPLLDVDGTLRSDVRYRFVIDMSSVA